MKGFGTDVRKAANAERLRGRSNFNDFIRRNALISSFLFLSAIYLQPPPPLYLQFPKALTIRKINRSLFCHEIRSINRYFSDEDNVRCKCCHLQMSDSQTQKI